MYFFIILIISLKELNDIIYRQQNNLVIYYMRIYCINLEHRKDRKQHSLEQFTKMGIPHDTVVYPHFTKDERGGAYGCFESHMKIWNDFYTNFPNEKYCLVFEDDFVAPPNSNYIIKKATEYLGKYNDIDIIFLHDICISVDNEANNHLFTCGYGATTHAMMVTRRYIGNIITKYGKLPEPNGRHIDFEISLGQFDKDNVLYSEKVFFTKEECFTQLMNNSDNYFSMFDEFVRKHFLTQQEQQQILKFFFKEMRKNKIIDDDQIKSFFLLLAHTIVRM